MTEHGAFDMAVVSGGVAVGVDIQDFRHGGNLRRNIAAVDVVAHVGVVPFALFVQILIFPSENAAGFIIAVNEVADVVGERAGIRPNVFIVGFFPHSRVGNIDRA